MYFFSVFIVFGCMYFFFSNETFQQVILISLVPVKLYNGYLLDS